MSEAGTYTIEKDSPSPEVDNARGDIERVFGILTAEGDGQEASSAGILGATTPGGASINNDQETFNDQDKFKVIIKIFISSCFLEC